MNAATQDGDSFDSPDGRTYSEPANAATVLEEIAMRIAAAGVPEEGK